MIMDAMGSSSEFGKGPEALERHIQRQIDELPTALQKRWVEEFENAEEKDLSNLEQKLRTFVRDRERVLIHTAPGTLGELRHADRDEARVRATLERIQEASERPDLYVGKGKTAEVFKDIKDPSLCYKTVVNFQAYASWNSIGKEAHFLEELEDLEVEGVRTPRVIIVVDLPNIKAIEMEYLDADNIKIIIEKNKPLPPNFDVTRFFKRVRAYVDAMHARNIYHRDLHGGNILVGKDGTPYIIDFGQSTESLSPDYAYEASDRAGNNRIVLPTDEMQLEGTESALRAYLIKRGNE